MRQPLMHILAAALLLAAAPGWAQITYSTATGSTYLPLEGATVHDGINVRLDKCPTGPWAFAVDAVALNTEGGCPFDLLGDDLLYDTRALSNGAHTVTAASTASPTLTARFTVANGTPSQPLPPVPAPGVGFATLTWSAPTQNTDGSALTNLAGFRIVYGTSADTLAQTVQIQNPGILTFKVDSLAPGAWFFAVRAYNAAGTDGPLSAVVTTMVTAPPPVCGAAPAAQSRSQLCVSPLIGNWTQLNAWTPAPSSAPAGTCWVADWQPASAPAGICAQPPPPPPTCPPKPIDATRAALCPAGTTGTFTQTRVSACLAGVWIPAATYTPVIPPAGSCPVVTTQWKVAPSLALPVYEAVLPASGTLVVRGAQVGTIALGKPCGAQLFTESGRSFRSVTASDVQLTSPSYVARSLVAACLLQ